MNPTAILTGDIHLRDTVPIARTDDYFKAQWKKINFLKKYQDKLNIPIIDAGDIFHKAKSSPYLESWAMQEFPYNVYTTPGNHDLPNHKLDNVENSSLNVLRIGHPGSLFIGGTVIKGLELPKEQERIYIHFFPYGQKLTNLKTNENYSRSIAIIHTLILSPDKSDYFGDKGESVKAIFKQLSNYDLILAGHNHKAFSVKQGDQLLVNPGSMMRMKTNQKDHKPRFYLWYAENNTVEIIFYPIEDNVINNDHIVEQKNQDERMASFIKKINDEYEVSLSFENNMDVFLLNNKVNTPVQNIIRESMVK